MKTGFRFVVVLFYIIFASSCKMASIVVDVQQPALWPLQDSIIELSLNNRIQDSTHISTGISRNLVIEGKGPEGLQQESSEIVLQFMKDELKKNDRYSAVSIIYVDPRNQSEMQLPSELDPQQVIDICKYNNSDAILSLEYFKSFSDLSSSSYEIKKIEEKNKVWTNNIAYDARTTTYKIARLVVGVEIDWRVYDGTDGSVLYDKKISDSLLYEGQARTLEDAEKKLPSVSQSLAKVSTMNGLRVLENLSPSFLTVERSYFRHGNNDFKDAYNLVLFRRWADAAIIWEQNAKNNNPKISSRAYYNLALIAEIDGKLDEARDHINHAYRLNPTTEIIKYKTLLDAM